VLRADPVSLVAGRNDVVLAKRIDDLDAGDAATLIATLNEHFGGDGLAFHAPRPDAWFVLVDVTPKLTTTPLAEVHGAIYPFLPGGDDGPRWRRWLSEMQMLLHEHPVNRAREMRGQVAVTGIWVADGGRVADINAGPTVVLFAPSGAAGDVARGLARSQGTMAFESPSRFSALPPDTSAAVVLDLSISAELARLESDWLHPAVAALEQGKVEKLTLISDGAGIAVEWQARRPSWHQRVRAKLARRPLAWPLPELEET
jgi:hypothetical protein